MEYPTCSPGGAFLSDHGLGGQARKVELLPAWGTQGGTTADPSGKIGAPSFVPLPIFDSRLGARGIPALPMRGTQDGKTVDNPGENGIIVAKDTEGAGDFEPDIIIGRNLGAKAKNYDIFTPDGEILNLAEGTHIRNVEVIAGQGRNRQIDMIDYLVDNYGGDSTKWKKCKGLGYVDVDGESLLAELHWYEEPSTGRVEFKIKPQPGGELFIYED